MGTQSAQPMWVSKEFRMIEFRIFCGNIENYFPKSAQKILVYYRFLICKFEFILFRWPAIDRLCRAPYSYATPAIRTSPAAGATERVFSKFLISWTIRVVWFESGRDGTTYFLSRRGHRRVQFMFCSVFISLWVYVFQFNFVQLLILFVNCLFQDSGK